MHTRTHLALALSLAFGFSFHGDRAYAQQPTDRSASYTDRETHTRASRLDMPPATRQRDFVLPVSDIFTATLVFPGDVVAVDHGSLELMTEVLDVVKNVVKVKASSEALALTSLTVITDTDDMYTFRVFYERDPATLTYDLGVLAASNAAPDDYPSGRPEAAPAPPGKPLGDRSGKRFGSLASADEASVFTSGELDATDGDDESIESAIATHPKPTPLIYDRTDLSSREIRYACERLAGYDLKGGVIARDKAVGSRLALDEIWIQGDIIYYRFTLTNTTAIAYDVDFWRFFVRDHKAAKRAAVQEIDQVPLLVYPGSDAARVEPYSAETFVVALEKFTIPDAKRLHLEVLERGGGRHHALKLKNSDIVDARYVGPEVR